MRKELLLAMPAVVKHMGQDYFVEHFLSALLLLLKDGVDEVREACAATIPSIASTGTHKRFIFVDSFTYLIRYVSIYKHR